MNYRNTSFKCAPNLVCAENEEVGKEKRQITDHTAGITMCLTHKYFPTFSTYVLPIQKDLESDLAYYDKCRNDLGLEIDQVLDY